MKNTNKDEFFDFVEPDDENEIAAFRELEGENYRKDGFENTFPSMATLNKLGLKKDDSKEATDNDEENDVDNENNETLNLNDSQLVEVETLEKPYILLQVPHPNE